MKDSRSVPKALSALTLLVVGSATAGVALAAPVQPGQIERQVLMGATTISSLDDLSMAEFEQTAAGNRLEALVAGGHHDDSFGSHHHHEAAAQPEKMAAATGRFNV